MTRKQHWTAYWIGLSYHCSKPRDPTFPLTLCLRGGDLETDVLVCKASRTIDQGNDINLGAAGLLAANIATTNPVP